MGFKPGFEPGDLPETYSNKYLRGKDNEVDKASALLFFINESLGDTTIKRGLFILINDFIKILNQVKLCRKKTS